MKMWDNVLIGSGISSLTTAIILASKGQSVCVLEHHSKPGGYMHAFKKMGYTYDSGAHYVGAMEEGQPFWALLNYLGVYNSNIFTPLDPNAFDVFRFRSKTVPEVSLCKGYDQTIASLTEKFPNEKTAIEKYFRKVEFTAKNFPTYEFNENYDEMKMALALEATLQEVAESLTKSPELLGVFYAYCGLHGVGPEDISFGLHAMVTDSLIRGPYGFNGSGDRLAEQFVNRLKSLGGEIHLETTVTELKIKNGEISEALCANGKSFTGKRFISSLHPQKLCTLLPEGSFPPAYQKRLDKMEESIGIFGIYGVAKAGLDLAPNRNYYFFR